MKLTIFNKVYNKILPDIIQTPLKKYKNKIIGCHLKDFYDQSKNLLKHDEQSAVGDGFIDWPKLLGEVKKTPCEVFVLEHDDPKDYKEYTTKSLEYLDTI